jgi:hypothetical protein
MPFESRPLGRSGLGVSSIGPGGATSVRIGVRRPGGVDQAFEALGNALRAWVGEQLNRLSRPGRRGGL